MCRPVLATFVGGEPATVVPRRAPLLERARKLAFIAGSPGPASDVRFAGFKAAFEHAGLSAREDA